MKKMICMFCVLAMLLGCAAMAEEMINSVEIEIHFTGDANVRSGPTLNDRGVDVAMKDSVRTFLFETSVDDRGVAWYLAGDGDVQGWVSSKYAQLTTAEGLELIAITEEPGVLVYEEAEIYAQPAGEAVLTTVALEDAAEIEFLDLVYEAEDNYWYCVRYGECEGWVSDACMELQNN